MLRAAELPDSSLTPKQEIATLQAIVSAMGIRDKRIASQAGFCPRARIAPAIAALRGLSVLFANPARLAGWAQTPNQHPICGGEAPADLLMGPCETRALAVSNWIQSFQAA